MASPADGIRFVLAINASLLGSIGAGLELGVKVIDKEKHPMIRTISDVFLKTLQSLCAAATLLLIGSIFDYVENKPLIYMKTLFGTFMVLTPVLNAFVQHSSDEPLKKRMDIVDRVASISAKTINLGLMAFTAGAVIYHSYFR